MQFELWVTATDVLPAVVNTQHHSVAQASATGHCALQDTKQPSHTLSFFVIFTNTVKKQVRSTDHLFTEVFSTISQASETYEFFPALLGEQRKG